MQTRRTIQRASILALAIVAGFGIGLAARRSQPATLPPLVLGDGSTETVVVTDPPAPSSTLDLPTTVEVDTTLAPETTVAAPETTQPPPETRPPSMELSLGTDGLMLNGSGEERLVDNALGCDGYTQSAAPGSARTCEEFTVGDQRLVWLDSGVSDQFELLLPVPSSDANLWTVVLTAPADGGNAPVRADVTGDGKAELLFSRRADDDTLRVDVVEVRDGDASVTLHLDLARGRARYDDARLSVWVASPQDGKFGFIRVSRGDSGWRQDFVDFVDESAVGSGQL
jgi:hypothetical protein